MKQLLFFIAVILLTISSFGQFSDTTELNTYIRDTIRDRRPNKVEASQVQKALLGVSSFLVPKYKIGTGLILDGDSVYFGGDHYNGINFMVKYIDPEYGNDVWGSRLLMSQNQYEAGYQNKYIRFDPNGIYIDGGSSQETLPAGTLRLGEQGIEFGHSEGHYDHTPDLTIDVQGNFFFDNDFLKSGEENDQYLTTDANGQLKLKNVTIPTISYPGSLNQIFYNSGGTIGASSDFTYDSTNRRLGIGLGTAGGSLDATLQIAGFSPPDQSTASGLSTNHLMHIYGANGGSTSYTSASGTITGGNGGYIQVQSGSGGQNTGASTTAKGGVGGLCQFGGGFGGNQTNSSAVNGTGGKGGDAQLYSGRGGTARGTGTVTGGAGGGLDIYSGDGGAAQGSTGTRVGGVGGRLYLQAGNGGVGTNGGGTGGSVEIYSGSGGNVGGTAGNIYIYPGYTSSSYGNIFLGINKSGNIGGSVGIGTNSFVSGEKLRVNGNTLISGTLTSNYLNMSSTLTPSSSSDGTGSVGDIRYDDNYIYIKTSTGWKRAALGTW